MKIAIFTFTSLLSLNAFSQSIYFPQKNYTDSATLAQSIPALANEVIRRYKNPDILEYWNSIFRYQLVAREYEVAKVSLDSFRILFNKTESNLLAGIQYESYMVTKTWQKKDSRSFNTLYPITFRTLYNNLPNDAKARVEGYFVPDVDTLKKEVQTQVKKLINTHKDTIKLADAQALCRTYNSYSVYSQIKVLALKFLTQEEALVYTIEDSVLIPTKSGATLSARIARKNDSPSPLPVILMYNIYAGPYDRTESKEAASHGYVGVTVNTRGKYLSPQNIEPFEHDAADAYDVIDWISKQPWCNGSVAMYGGSYLGFSQWSAVKKVHPALKTIVPQVSVGIGIDYPLHNNVFMSYMLQWIHYVSNNKLTDTGEFFNADKWRSLYRDWYRSGKSFRALDSLEGRPNVIFQRWLDHPAYDSFWYNMVPYKEEFGKITIPVLTTTGYFDDDQRGAFYYFNQHYKYNKNANHYLLIGPYDHGGAQSIAQPYLNGYTLDSVANININETVFLWFDHILKNGPMPSLLKDKINYQVMGSNTWKHAPNLTKINNDTLIFYLSTVRTKNHYQLHRNKPKTKDYITQEISYTDRSNAAVNLPELVVIDSTLRIEESMSFISEPFEEPLDINGSFMGEIKFSINKKDIDLTVSLYELQPNGNYFMLSNYLGRASYNKNHSKRQLLTPGKEESVAINNSYFVSKHLEKGSRLIVLVGMNKKRDWQINYGSGKDVSDETMKDGKIPLRIKWSNTSTIKIPVFQ